MRYFLIFHLNLGFMECWALVLLILSNFDAGLSIHIITHTMF